jgi:DNA-binding CsgD family transcriptional regulator
MYGFGAVVRAARPAASHRLARQDMTMEQMTDQGGSTPPEPATPREAHPDVARRWAFAWPAGLFLTITFFVAADLAYDISAGAQLPHLVLEVVALAVAMVGVFGTAVQLRNALRRARALQHDLEGARAAADHWRGELDHVLQDLNAAIDSQFQRWDLTTAERGVALLILKGLSYKEVADTRGTSERTVRHQALAIYRKAGLAGRAEMAAFFLEDLLQGRAGRPREATRQSAQT